MNGLRRILVIANRTCPCPTLADEVAGRAAEGPIDVLVVAPALNSRLRHWLSEIGDADPLLAAADALASYAADEIVIVTYPPGESNWLEQHLVDKARKRFRLPIAHLVSSYGLVEEERAA
jgi:hypothetical protein